MAIRALVPTGAVQGDILREALGLYRHLHANPELSGAEAQTAEAFAARLGASGFDVTTGVGGHGVVGRLTNGAGPTVLLRAELDALPVAEETGLSYASDVVTRTADGAEVPVMHACGHDLHLASLAGAAAVLSADRERWRGTLLTVGQPAEETLLGAAAMMDDGLYHRWGRPDVALAQHSAPLPAGMVAHGELMTAGSVTLEITIDGRGGHPAMPHLCVDPVVTAASIVTQLQTIRSQRIDPSEPAVLTVGQFSAGSRANVIADSATIGVTMRAYSAATLSQMREAVERIVRAACTAAGTPGDPRIAVVAQAPVNRPDPRVTARVRAAHADAFGAVRVGGWPPSLAAEDFPVFGADGVATGYWMLGTISPAQWRAAAGDAAAKLAHIPGNHSPRFAPHAALALPTGIQALVSAALCWLGADPDEERLTFPG
ncbi:amidohydrolase [Plantactinospora sp. KLBMP9567]|uniref:amidohydrolase n=1 Tax=Plantactinospora sp. KLBMP9567 TaxID=3085900 RepID=UPI0029825B01|nr:amidohydrolase [Plantactinospora sp. KLBMP9567]MDW5326600.1 amidohydrolase [Plantactinospora sp. KLBMP9567]